MSNIESIVTPAQQEYVQPKFGVAITQNMSMIQSKPQQKSIPTKKLVKKVSEIVVNGPKVSSFSYNSAQIYSNLRHNSQSMVLIRRKARQNSVSPQFIPQSQVTPVVFDSPIHAARWRLQVPSEIITNPRMNQIPRKPKVLYKENEESSQPMIMREDKNRNVLVLLQA